jgi:GDP-D-mannose 3',5'-epimerase
MKRILVAGAGGFIGGHLAAEFLKEGHQVTCVDIKPFEEWYQSKNLSDLGIKAVNDPNDPTRGNYIGLAQCDLKEKKLCDYVTSNIDEVYNLAADMGGMGFIENNKALCMLSVLINTHLLQAAKENGVKRYFYASSACVYNGELQKGLEANLKEEDAYPALAEDGYGWEKLFSERMCRHFREDYGLQTRIARFHNVYGPNGTYDGGREKAPAAICRKVIQAKRSGNHIINIWGDGLQTRSFMYIDDCIKGIRKIMDSDWVEPINLGRNDPISINRLVDIAENIAGIKLERTYNLDAPKGVRGRNSDNTLIKKVFGWEPSIPMEEGLKKTYEWINGELK